MAQLGHIDAIERRPWNNKTALPVDSYSEEEVVLKTEDLYRHIYWAYPTLPSPYLYSTSAA